jgi:hypothetical protein
MTPTDRQSTRKCLLFLSGTLFVLWGVAGVFVGLFVGPHILGPGLLLLASGTTAVWLESRSFDARTRTMTLIWSISNSLFLMALTMRNMQSLNNAPAAIFAGGVFIVAATVGIMAVQTAPRAAS